MPLGANKAAIMGVSGVSTADVVLIQSQTATSDASLSFTSGIDSTYGEYIFKFYNCNPETDNAVWTFNVSVDGGSNYDAVLKTTTYFRTYHDEANSGAVLQYVNTQDLAQSANYQHIGQDVGNGSDESCAGVLHLFNPSSTTYIKHFYNVSEVYAGYDYTYNSFSAGYCNTTSAINAVAFKMSAGDFDGTIKLWGVK